MHSCTDIIYLPGQSLCHCVIAPSRVNLRVELIKQYFEQTTLCYLVFIYGHSFALLHCFVGLVTKHAAAWRAEILSLFEGSGALCLTKIHVYESETNEATMMLMLVDRTPPTQVPIKGRTHLLETKLQLCVSSCMFYVSCRSFRSLLFLPFSVLFSLNSSHNSIS